MPQFELDQIPNPYTGRLIALTGIRGAGKTTLLQRMVGVLAEQGLTAVTTKQHTDEFYTYPVFQSYMSDTDVLGRGEVDITALTLISLGDTMQLLRTSVIPLLRRGIWVLLDRYIIDQVAGFSVFSGSAGELEVVKSVANLLLKPDLAFFIDLDGALAIQRVIQRDGRREHLIYDSALYDLSNQRFLEFAQANRWHVIDGSDDLDAIFAQILHVIDEHRGVHKPIV